MEYMGRIKLDPIEYLNKTVVLDHWAYWFFHIFMDTDPNSEVFGKAPLRLGSAYAGFAVYSNWEFGPPAAKDPEVWTRGIPTKPMAVGPDKGKMCINPKKVDYCADIRQTNFPPAPEAAPSEAQRTAKTNPFFPHGDAVLSHIHEQLAKEIVV
jgi:hypothetical protein